MKKSITLLIAMLFGLSAFSAKPIFSITKWDEGRRGFKNVSTILAVNDLGQEGWVVNCIDPGRTQCRPPMGSTAPEGVDTDVFEEAIRLVEYADNEWDQGFTSGSYVTEFHSLQGEKSLKVEWEVVDRIRYITVSLEE